MARIVVIISIVLTGCDVGERPSSNNMTDGGGGGGDGSNNAVCEQINATPPDGHHNPGQSCQVAGCHLIGQADPAAPAFSYSGTLYKEAAGTTAYPGATIFVKLGATEKKIITANNGNFWMVPGVAGLDSPDNANQGETKASGCPTTPPMSGKLVQGGGNCNNCHRNGGTTSPIYPNP